jgi:hypothetical protein
MLKNILTHTAIALMLTPSAHARGAGTGGDGSILVLIIFLAFIGFLIYALAKKLNGGRRVDNSDYAVAMVIVLIGITIIAVILK